LLAVIQQATFCWAMPIKEQALFFSLKYGLFQTIQARESAGPVPPNIWNRFSLAAAEIALK
jgi:hypothetical protein